MALPTAGKGKAWPNALSSDFEPSALKKERGRGMQVVEPKWPVSEAFTKGRGGTV